MAELTTATRTQVAQSAGRKAEPSSFNRERGITIDTPPVWSAALNDTAGTSQVIPAGARLLPIVTISNGAGSAGSTLAIGLRDATTKVVLDATAIMAATSIAAAQTVSVVTGTKSTVGTYYILPVDAEVYLTFGGAAPLANQAISAYVRFIAA